MRPRTGIAAFLTVLSAAGALAAGTAASASTAQVAGGGQSHDLVPGDLLVSESHYRNDPNIVAGQTVLPPGCTTGCVTAVANGDYPNAFNNDTVDGSFGVTSKLFLREITPQGHPQDVISVPVNELTTSFSSKSEGALNLSTDGKYVTFMGYVAPDDSVDVPDHGTPRQSRATDGNLRPRAGRGEQSRRCAWLSSGAPRPRLAQHASDLLGRLPLGSAKDRRLCT